MNRLEGAILVSVAMIISVLVLTVIEYQRPNTEGEHKAYLRGLLMTVVPLSLALLVGSWLHDQLPC